MYWAAQIDGIIEINSSSPPCFSRQFSLCSTLKTDTHNEQIIFCDDSVSGRQMQSTGKLIYQKWLCRHNSDNPYRKKDKAHHNATASRGHLPASPHHIFTTPRDWPTLPSLFSFPGTPNSAPHDTLSYPKWTFFISPSVPSFYIFFIRAFVGFQRLKSP